MTEVYAYEVKYWTLEQAEAMPYGLPMEGDEMATPLICDKCGKEIEPGTKVEMVGAEEFEGLRIVADGDMLIVHAECPDLAGSQEG